ncbi:MAG: hypothetical protein Q9159_001641 [Coniocarpon cinnabarinum]
MFWQQFTSRTLANSGSTARDHLASERTLLAWLRTGLGFVALGLAVERVGQLDLTKLPDSSRSPSTLMQELDDRRKRRADEEHIMALERGLYKPALFGVGSIYTKMTEIGELAYRIGGKVTLEVEEGKKQEIVKAFRGHSRKCKLQTDHGVWQSARRRATEYEAEYFENIRQAIEGSVEKKERHPRDQWRRKGGITHAQAL